DDDKELNRLVITPDGQWLFGGDDVGRLYRWDRSGRCTDRLVLNKTGTSTSNALAVSPNGKTLATGGFRYPLQLWNLPGLSLRATSPESKEIRAIAFAPDGQSLGVATGDPAGPAQSRIRLLDAAQGKQIAEYPGCPSQAVFARHGEWLAAPCI